jgi:5'-nucleotidase
MKTKLLLALMLGTTYILAGCLGIKAGTGTPIDLTILHIDDHHSHLDAETTTLNLKDSTGAAKTVTVDFGGFARVGQAITEISAQSVNVLKLHGGDAITGDLYYTQSEGAADAAVMNTVCFDAFTLGNHEFDNGDAGLVKFIDFLHANTNTCNTPVLSANLNPAGSALKQRVQPYTIIQRGGQNIGIIGITAAYKTMHASRPDAGTTLSDEVITAQATIDKLRSLGVDKIILMAHEGYDADVAIAPKLDGVDVIVGGDSHTLLGPDSMKSFGLTPAGAYPTQVSDKNGKKVCIVHAWQYNYAVGELKVSFDTNGDVTTCAGTPHVLVGDTYKVGSVAASTADATAFRAGIDASSGAIRTTAPSTTVTSVLAPFKTAKDAFGVTVVGSTTDNLCLRRVPGMKIASELTRSKLTGCNTDPNVVAHGGDIQQLVAEAFLAQGKRFGAADIALQNGGGVRTDITAGNITVATVFGLLPFKNLLVRMTLSGTEIKSSLEEGVDSVMNGTGTGAYPYTAGLRFDVDMTKPLGSRVSNLQFRQPDRSWIVFDMTKNYSVITNDFTSIGGDNYNTLKAVPASRQEKTFLDYADSFLQYVKDKGTLSKLPVSDYSTQSYIE